MPTVPRRRPPQRPLPHQIVRRYVQVARSGDAARIDALSRWLARKRGLMHRRFSRDDVDILQGQVYGLEGRLGRVPPGAEALRREIERRLTGSAEGEGEADRNGPVIDAMLDVALAAARNPQLVRQRRLVR